MQEDTCKKAKGQKLNPANILAVVFLVGLVSLDMALHYHRGTQIQQLGELTSRLDLELKLLQSTRSINQVSCLSSVKLVTAWNVIDFRDLS